MAEVTILSGQSLSDPVDISSVSEIKIEMPASWDVADLTVQARAQDGTYKNVYDEADTELIIKAAAGRIIVTSKLKALGWIKLRSGTSSVAVNQTADRTIYIDGKMT